VHVERHTTVNRMTGDGAVGSQKQAGNRLTSTTVLGRLDIDYCSHGAAVLSSPSNAEISRRRQRQ